MPKIPYISDAGASRTIDAPVGDTVMEGAVQNGVDGIVAECGGNCQCGTCHVYVEEKFLPLLDPIGEDQDAMLDTTASALQGLSARQTGAAPRGAAPGGVLRNAAHHVGHRARDKHRSRGPARHAR